MNRFWAGLFALMVTGLAATAAQAATIEVTTFGESGDNDDVCSIREATVASSRANLVSARKSARAVLVTAQETLDRNLNRLRLDALEHYPKSDLLEVLRTIRDDLGAHTPVAPAEIAARDELLNFLVDPDPLAGDGNGDTDPDDGFIHIVEEMLGDKVFYQQVIITRDLIDDSGSIDTDPHDGDSDLDAPQIGSNDALTVLDAELARLDERNEVDGCANGTSFDTISLSEGTYTLTDGEVVIDSRISIRGAGDTSIIQAGSGARHFVVPKGVSAELQRVQLVGGDAGAGNGGAVSVAGSLSVTEVLFSGNAATHGGALFAVGSIEPDVNGGSLTLSQVRFFNNTATGNGGAIAVDGAGLTMTDVTFGRVNPDTLADEGNSAVGNGGAVYYSPLKEGGGFSIERASVVRNTASIGSAFYVGGDAVDLVVINATIARNDAGNRSAIEVATTGDGSVAINNVTMIGNTAVSGTAGIRVVSLTAVVVANSLLADNTGAGAVDCEFLAVVNPLDFNRNYYGVGSACPGPIYDTGAPDPADTNFQLASGTAVGYLVNPFDEELGLYIPLYPDDVNDSAEIRLVNRGAGILEPFRCVEQDQRNRARSSVFDDDCDIGAIEYQTGRPVDDEIVIPVGRATCIDIIGNDIGDAEYIPGTLTVVNVERAGATAIVVATTACPNAADMDATFPDAILFTPPRGFRGETNVTYSLQWQTQGATPVQGDLSGIAHVTTEPNKGITSSSLGNFGLGALSLTALLALRRRVRASVVVLSGVVMLAITASVPAVDNIIYVTTGDDDTVITNLYGDGECSLREALSTARNDQANLTRGDCLDGNEGPDVIEILVPVVTLAGTVEAYGGVTVRCQLESEEPCILAGNDTFRLINTNGSLGIDRMILQGGNAGAGNGGAILSGSGVSISNSILRDNSAYSGGAVFLRGIRGDLTIGNSLFMGNASTGADAEGGGGVVGMSAADSHKVTVSNSTFYDNSSIAGPAAMDVNSISTTVIANSTFSENTSTAGSGALDFVGALASVTLHNITVVGNLSANGFSAVHFGTGTTSRMVANSLISNNLDASAANANCRGTFESYFNLYGEGTGAVTCVLPPTNTNLVRDPALVFDGAGPDDLEPLNFPTTFPGTLDDLDALTIAEDGFIPPHHVFADPEGVDGILVDAGFEDGDPLTGVELDLVDPLNLLSEKCANVDLRGKSRQSGGRCDIGAWEWVQITALPDQGSNTNRNDRIAVIDVLENDLVEDGQRCVPDAADIVPSAPPDAYMHARLIQTTPGPLVCVDVRFIAADGTARFVEVIEAATDDEPDRKILDETGLVGADPDFEYEIDTESEFVLTYRRANDALIPADDPLVLEYVAGDNINPGQNFSLDAEIEIIVLNAPPRAEADKVSVPVGSSVVIDVLANDSDRDAGLGPDSDDLPTPPLSANGLNIASVRISDGSCEAIEIPATVDTDGDSDVDEFDVVVDYWQCQFGKARVNPATGAITWTPDNVYNPFTETFTYEVSDFAVEVVPGIGADEDDPLYDKDVSLTSTATVTIRMDRPSANGGSILGEDDLSDILGIDFLGATGNLFFLALGLGALRRRSVRRRR